MSAKWYHNYRPSLTTLAAPWTIATLKCCSLREFCIDWCHIFRKKPWLEFTCCPQVCYGAGHDKNRSKRPIQSHLPLIIKHPGRQSCFLQCRALVSGQTVWYLWVQGNQDSCNGSRWNRASNFPGIPVWGRICIFKSSMPPSAVSWWQETMGRDENILGRDCT